MISQETLQRLLSYEDGVLRRKSGTHKGKICGTPDSHGYLQTLVDGRRYSVHRLVFLYHHGYLPEIVDHIDRDHTNNRIENLREASKSENQRNRKKKTNKSSRFLGVSWEKGIGKWRANITADGKTTTVGFFECEVEAARARDKKALELHGEFASLNLWSER